MQEAWEKAQKRIRLLRQAQSYARYRDDPVGFLEREIGAYLTDELCQIAESVRDNPVTIVRSGNDLGKSFSAARLMIWYFLIYEDSKVFATAAPPLENLKTILWGEVGAVVNAKPSLFTGMRVKTLGIYRHANSFIKGVAIPISGTSEEREAKFSGKHAPHMFFVVDEGDAVPEEVYRGIESCMSGGHVRLLIMFNPRATIGTVYEMERKRQANVIVLNALKHPNVVTGKNLIPGAVSRQITLRRINEWTRELAVGERDDGDDIFEPPQYLVGETVQSLDGAEYPPLPPGKRKIIKPEFSYMVLGRYPVQSSWRLISDDWIERAVKRWEAYTQIYGEAPPAGVAPIMGCDLAEYGSDYNVACFRYGNYVERLTLWMGVDTDLSADKALQLYLEKGAKIAMIDSTGVGTNVAPAMARRGREHDVRAVSIKASEKPSPLIRCEFGEFYMLRDQLWWALRLWLEKEEAMLPPDGLLLEELRAVEYDFTAVGRRIKVTGKDELRRILKRSTDRSDALCLTFAPFTRAQWTSVEEAQRKLRAEAGSRERAENSGLVDTIPASIIR